MLPPTVFPFFRPSLEKNHPANKQSTQEFSEAAQMDVDAMALASELDQSFFTEPFFEASMRTFQVCRLRFMVTRPSFFVTRSSLKLFTLSSRITCILAG